MVKLLSVNASNLKAMGRIGEVVCRTWQTADKMKLFRGKLAEETVNVFSFQFS